MAMKMDPSYRKISEEFRKEHKYLKDSLQSMEVNTQRYGP